MAVLPNQSSKVRHLRELLEERQEPFVLDVYLLEKGLSKKIGNSDSCKDSWLSFVSKNREGSPKCSKVMKSVLAKVLFGKALKKKNLGRKACNVGRFGDFCFDSDRGRETQVEKLHQFSSALSLDDGSCSNSFSTGDVERETQVTEMDRISSASCTTLFDSCFEGSMEEFTSVLKVNILKDKASTDRRLQSMEDSKQFSPVSVLEIPFDDGSPRHNQIQVFPRTKRRNPAISSFNLAKEVAKDSILSTSMWEHLVHSFTEQEELRGFISSSVGLSKSKRMLQQKRKLLLDCVREVVERSLEKGARCQVLEYAETRNNEKIVLDQIFSWGKQGGNATNITQILGCDLMEAKLEWDQFQPQMPEIQIEIADVIFEEITNEIVVDMLDSFELKRF